MLRASFSAIWHGSRAVHLQAGISEIAEECLRGVLARIGHWRRIESGKRLSRALLLALQFVIVELAAREFINREKTACPESAAAVAVS